MNTVRRRGPRPVQRVLRIGALSILALLGCWTGAAMASTSGAVKTVRYQGYPIVVPATWPVFHLSSDPTVCVRFNRHALYLGAPGSQQRCPAHSVGRTEAILVAPLSAAGASAGGHAAALPATRIRDAQPRQGSQAQVILPARRLIVTATWNTHPSVVGRAIGERALTAGTAGVQHRAVVPARAAAVAPPGIPAGPGAVYTGLGFDACNAPSAAQMSAWGASSFRAAGVYVGGTNMACSQPNLTAAWVSAESAAGWHLIPTYVGLQAPTNSCGCAGINPRQASAEGTAAASDAVARSQALGLGPGNPIYFDMEAYPTGGTNTSAVLTFLSAWTVQLHAEGYVSGVYGSGASGIRDLAAQFGTGFAEPDDIWIADWNGEQTTSDPFVPNGDWASQQRLHQYSGSHNDTFAGTTLNIDSNYLNGATAAAGTAGVTVATPLPQLTVAPSVDGSIALHAGWAGVAGVSAWRMLAGTNPAALTPLSSAATPGSQISVAIRSAFPYFAVQAFGSASQLLATSPVVATPAHLAIYGRTVFTPAAGLAGLPAGCFTGNPCHVSTKILAGRTVVASTGTEAIPAGGSGILFFKLTPAGRQMLSHAPGHRLPVTVTARDSSGTTATTTLTLVRFLTKGRGPRRSLAPSPTLRLIGATDFVSSGWVGGLLAGCSGAVSCHVTSTITVRGTTIASAGPQWLGANELGYLTFKLTPQGHAMLMHAAGNQLGARVTMTDGSATATGTIVLVKFS